jgi:MFS family permease
MHLYLDIAWFGVLSGTTIAFVAVFAARQGADALQIGLLNAGPAIMNLFFTLPAGRWLENRPIGKAVFWTSVGQRLFYLPWVVLPALLAPSGQVWSLIVLTLLMSIPATPLAVGFNAMFAAAVPPDWRGHVVGIRNVLLAVTYMATSLLAGFVLDWLPFPLGYQVVFAIGFLGAMMSSFHLWHLRRVVEEATRPRVGRSLGEFVQPGTARSWGDSLRSAVGLRFLMRSRGARLLRTELLSGRFGVMIAVLFAFHLTQYLAIPLFPLYWVRELRLTDQEISLGTALFYLAMLLGSTQLARLTERFGHHKLTAVGAIVMSSYPLLTGLSQELGLFLVTSVVGGLSWSLVGGALPNYILERVPADDRPAHLAWYNLTLNGAVLLGSLGGPFVANEVGLVAALVVIAGLRLASALAIRRWG